MFTGPPFFIQVLTSVLISSNIVINFKLYEVLLEIIKILTNNIIIFERISTTIFNEQIR